MSNQKIASIEPYELFAIRYATRDAVRSEHFIGGDPHDGPMPMDYFIWLAKNKNHTVVIDTGFNQTMAEKRNRRLLKCPVKILTDFGVSAGLVNDVILTHLHYDHSGNFDQFFNAQFHLQEQEIQYATGQYMRYAHLNHTFEVDDICGIIRLNYQQRVTLYNGDSKLSSGIGLHRTGGHSAGLQFVSIYTKRGWVILASDASHYYEHFETYRPFSIAFHVGEMITSFDKLLFVAKNPNHIIPGHDPKVMERYPHVDGFEGKIVKLDEEPKS